MPKLKLEASDFVDIVDENGTALPAIPKSWVGTRLMAPGWQVAGQASEASDDSPEAGYKRLKKAELEFLIAERNLARADEDVISDNGTKDELVARLVEDDEKQA